MQLRGPSTTLALSCGGSAADSCSAIPRRYLPLENRHARTTLVLALIAVAAQAQPAVAIREWPVPWEDTRPRDPAVDKKGTLAFHQPRIAFSARRQHQRCRPRRRAGGFWSFPG